MRHVRGQTVRDIYAIYNTYTRRTIPKQYIYLSIYLSIFIYLWIYVCMYVCIYIYLSIYLSVYLSIYTYTCIYYAGGRLQAVFRAQEDALPLALSSPYTIHIHAITYMYALYNTCTRYTTHIRAIQYIYAKYNTCSRCTIHIYNTCTRCTIHIRAIKYIYAKYNTYSRCRIHVHYIYVYIQCGVRACWRPFAHRKMRSCSLSLLYAIHISDLYNKNTS